MTTHPNRKRVWRVVVRALPSSLYRRVNGSHNTTACVWLELQCGHRVRETGVSHREVNDAIANGCATGRVMRRHCRECAAKGRVTRDVE